MKIGFTCGSFDLCHAGHVLMFQDCKKHCDWLIVGLQSDPSIDRPEKHRPVMTVMERLTLLENIRGVDEVFIYNTEADLLEYLKQHEHRIDVRFLGADWMGKPFTGHELSINVMYNDRSHGYSTSELRQRVVNA